jgi:hypothetical protein
VVQVVEHLPSKCEALSSTPTTAKTNKKQKQKQKNPSWATLKIMNYFALQR